jgi:DNA polymerase
MSAADEMREELRDLAVMLREHLLAQQASGAVGLPAFGPGSRAMQPAEPSGLEPGAPIDDGPVPSVAPPPVQPAVAPAPMTEPQERNRLVVPAPELGAEERVARLSLLEREVAACTRCRLHAARTQTVFSRGSPRAELMFVGEGPGAEEDAQGQPFVGKAGQLLDRMIAAMGLERDGVYVCNVVKCRPPDNRMPEPEEMEACAPYLARQIELVAPRVIVALGTTAVRGLLGTGEGITRLRGTWKLYRATIPVMPTFHPAYLLRKEEAKREVWEDLKAVLKHLGRNAPERRR